MTLRAVLSATAIMTSAAAFAQQPAPAVTAAAPAAASASPAAPAAPAEPAVSAAASAPAASATTEIAAGATVFDSMGGPVGTIESVDADTVTVATPNAKANLPKASFALGPNGAVISMTQSQLEAAVKGSKPSAG